VRRRLSLAVLLCCAVLPVSAAHASSSQFMTFEAPVQLLDDSSRDATLDQLQGLGVRSLRTLVTWRDVAPSPDAAQKPSFDASNPAAYNWGVFDRLVSAARARGMRLYFTLTGPVPKWATEGKTDNVTRPIASEFGQFATAAGRHFGTSVSYWSIWNEPNHPQFLLPQKVHGRAVSGTIYRPLLTAAISGLRSAGITAPILMGETAPAGSTHDVAPLTFLRQALCLSSSYHRSSKCGKVNVNGYAHHPYTKPAGPFYVPPSRDDVMIGSLSRLSSALDKAARAGAIPSHLPIYLTEFGTQSFPDKIAGVSWAKQSDYRSLAEWIAYHNPRVRSFSQYLLVDSAPVPGAPAFARYPGFESGLYTYQGQQKPVYDSFRTPLVARQRGGSVALWGLVRPATGPGTVTVLYARAHSSKYRTLKRVHYKSSGYWTASARFSKGTRYRVRWRDATGQTFTGPPTAIYKF
jgi:hypothetical protein